MILQDLMPLHHFSEKHHVITSTRPAQLYQAIQDMDLSNSAIVKALYRLRRMPATSLTLKGMKDIGFNVLGSKTDQEYVIGLIGKFWKPIPQIINVLPGQFKEFNEKGYAKAALNYLIQETNDGIRLSTETRIYCTSSSARLAFLIYWTVIRPFSGLIRRSMLRNIVKRSKQYVT